MKYLLTCYSKTNLIILLKTFFFSNNLNIFLIERKNVLLTIN